LLNLKPLACILISTGSTWDIATKYWYVLPQVFESQICTLTIPTSSTTDTVRIVERKTKQWCDFLANNSSCGYSPIPYNQRATPSSTPPFLSSAINPTIVCCQSGHRCCPRHHPCHHPCPRLRRPPLTPTIVAQVMAHCHRHRSPLPPSSMSRW
jgi:hypothetical protein